MQRGKFDPSSKPGLFCGWRFDAGPKSFKQVYYVIDYKRVKNRESGFPNPIAVPAEELFVEEGNPILPLKSAAEEALNSFGEAKLQDIAPLEIPFSSIVHDSKTSRNEYITLDRIIKYGATPNCCACAFSLEHSTHSPICRARFNGLIRADRIAASTKTPVSPRTIAPSTPLPPIPETPGPEFEVEPIPAGTEGADRDALPFSAGSPPGDPEEASAMINRVASTIDESFVRSSVERARHRHMHSLPGHKCLV